MPFKRNRSQDDNGDLPLKRLRSDPLFWAKIAALWHRERIRDQYASTGFPSHEARRRANVEALDVARAHGWIGDVKRLKSELAELLTRDLPGLRKHGDRGGPHFWEDVVHAHMMQILGGDEELIRIELKNLLYHEVATRGRLAGQVGFYKLTFLITYIPTMDHLSKRNAFIRAISEVGHDSMYCDQDLFRVVMRFVRPFSMRPFETRLGFSMPRGVEVRERGARGVGRRLLEIFGRDSG